MGRASNRKKARREAARKARPTRQGLQTEAAGSPIPGHEAETHGVQQTLPQWAWCGGREPVAAEVPQWPEGSLGGRFFSSPYLARARSAPCLLTADVPHAMAIIADPAQWSVAAHVLVRAVVFDGLRVDHPAVSRLLDVLAPIAVAELAYERAIEDWYACGWDEGSPQPEFPDLDGPVFLIGMCALADAAMAVLGDDPLSEALTVLEPALDDAIPGLEGRDAAGELFLVSAQRYRRGRPSHAELLSMQHAIVGGALQRFVDTRVVPPGDILRVGLTILSVLAGFCKSASPSILRRAA
jgi:hypothetical protein